MNNHTIRLSLWLCFLIPSLAIGAQERKQLLSPSGTLKAEITVDKKSAQIKVYEKGEKIVSINALQFTLEKDVLKGDLQIVHSTENTVNQTWQPIYGERSLIPERYNEVRIRLQSSVDRKEIALIARMYDEGFAFKYEFDRLDFWNQTLLQENTQFVFEKDCMTWTTSRAQGAYKSQLLSEQSEVCDRPQVIKIDEGHFAAIGEAALVNYARMKLAKNEEGWGVRSVLSGKVDLGLANYQSPWRYVMLANHPGQLVQNNYFILNLNEPNQIKDTRWIKPGQVIREVTLTTKGSLAAIDLAAENKIPYVEFDAGWYGSEYDPNSDATTITVDPKRSEGPLDLHQVIQYAKEKGIGIILYINMKALHKQLDEVLPLYQKWGIKGVKYGFVDVGDQYSTAWLHHAVRKAAKYKLMVDIHDEYRPTGYSRTYPNLLTQEGIRGDEESPSLKESIYTLYNRMICGAGDQTNCYFAQRVTDKMGGRAAQLAKLVAIYSPWQFIYWYDRPAAAPPRAGGAGAEESIIQKDEITDFYCSIPTVWDDTRFLEGEMGEYAVVARRSGSDWYISVLNAGKKRKIALPLDLLENRNQYRATLYYQASNTSKNEVKIKKINLSDHKALTIDIIANSGCVLHLSVSGAQQEKETLKQAIEGGSDKNSQCNGTEDRNLWIKTLCRIADPVLENLSSNTLKKNMPYESLSKNRRIYSHLEAVGRLVCGIAPWLELGKEETPEGKLRAHYIDLTVKGLKNAVDPQSPDYLEFGKPSQPLVDAAFLAQGLLRAPKQLWGNLDQQTRDRMITELKRTRNIKPSENNWLLFSSMVEAALLEFTNECDQSKLLYGIQKFQNEWYKGDAIYGDGSQFHMDYYNSFVIHPMLTDILQVMKKHTMKEADFLDTQIKRHTRYAEILERYISPEGTFPAVGRSIVYRFGAFHALSQAALHHILPNTVSPSQVRCALTAVIRNQMKSDANFDNNGWLSVGFTGKQIEMSESYINTGSAYLCSFGLLALGLPDSDPFWSAPDEEWTNLRAWNGGKVAADHALKDK